MAERRPMGALEAEVLDVLWRADGPVTPPMSAPRWAPTWRTPRS